MWAIKEDCRKIIHMTCTKRHEREMADKERTSREGAKTRRGVDGGINHAEARRREGEWTAGKTTEDTESTEGNVRSGWKSA